MTWPSVAAAEARRRGHRVAGPEHLLAALLRRPDVRSVLGASAELLELKVDAWLDGLEVLPEVEPAVGKPLERVLARAAAAADPPSEVGRLLLALGREANQVADLLREVGWPSARLASAVAELHLAEGAIPEGLFRIVWDEAPVPAREAPPGRWMFAGMAAPDLGEACRPVTDDRGGIRADHLVVGGAGDDPAEVEEALLQAVRALRAMPRGIARVWLLSRGDAAGAALLGLGRTLARERPELRVTRLEVAPDLPLAPILAAEAVALDDEVRRGAVRSVPRLEPVVGTLAPPAAAPSGGTLADTSGSFLASGAALRLAVPASGGTLLVTGGLGALGLAVARHLAPRFRRVVLVGRAAHRDRVELLRRDLPAALDLRVELADVADEAALRAILARLPEPPRVVVHAAGVSEDARVDELDDERLVRILRPKVRGRSALEAALADHPPERIVSLSSIAGVLGSSGQGAYAAANAALDHLAAARGGPWRSVAFGPWAGPGMAAGHDHARLGAAPLSAEHGLALLDAALALEHPVLVAARLSGSPALGASVDPDTVVAEVLRALSPRTTYDPDRPLAELGLDSLLSLEARSRLSARTGLRLPATLLQDHPTGRALAAHLAALRAGPEVGGAEVADATPAPAAPDDPIAIVGASCRLPGGVSDLDGLFELLRSGRPATAPIPAERFDVEALHHPEPGTPGRTCARRAALVDDLASFDPQAFGIPAWEAEWMDPQQRLLLMGCLEALADARRARAEVRGRPVGVFVGLAEVSYASRAPADPTGWPSVLLPGMHPGFAAARIATALGLTGPAAVVNTACSSGLVALHEAIEALRAGTCELALVGAAQALCGPEGFVTLSQLGLLSPTDAARPFDAAADGTVRGEGCVVLVLRRWSGALADGDPVLALIRGSAVRQAGLAASPSTPHGPSQEQVMRDALAVAGLRPGEVDLVEAHAVGTPIGDAVEAASVSAVYGVDRSAPLVLGSVKAAIGHLEAASGLAGLLSVLAALRREAVPPRVGLERPSPELRLEGVDLAREGRPWARGARPRVAGVSAFSITGSHVHVLVEEPPARIGLALRPEVERPRLRPARHWLAPAAARPAPVVSLGSRDEALAHLRRELADLLGAEVTVGEDAPLASVGFDSMRAVELRRRLLLAGADVPLRTWMLDATLGHLADAVVEARRAGPGVGSAPEVAASAPVGAPEAAQPSLVTHGVAVLLGMGLMLLLLLVLRQVLPDYAPALPDVEVTPAAGG